MTTKIICKLFVVVLLLNFSKSNAQSAIKFPVSDTTTVHKVWKYKLPIWGQKVTDRNIELQKPFGLNINYVSNEIQLELTEFSMNFYDGQNLDELVNPETLNFTETIATTNGVNIRADAWILPFLNFYGLYSRNQGSTKVSFQPQITEYGLGQNGNLKQITTLENAISVPKVLFDTNSFGMGTTLVYGWSNYFINTDVNMTWTTSDLLEETVKFLVGSARIGRRVTFANDMKLAVYIGVMYREFVDKENNTGSLGVPELDEGIGKAIDGLTAITDTRIELLESLPSTPEREEEIADLYVRKGKLESAGDRVENGDAINYKIKKEIIDNWSTQVGFNFEINDNWMYRGELGYSAYSRFFMTGLQYRFGF